jgi:hypothetical protein
MECNEEVARNAELHDAWENGVAEVPTESRLRSLVLSDSKGNLAVVTASAQEGTVQGPDKRGGVHYPHETGFMKVPVHLSPHDGSGLRERHIGRFPE